MVTLRQGYDPRRNSFDLIRLALAALVAVSHGIVMHTGTQPQWGMSTLGDFAVDGFFVLSGFLVASSYLRTKPRRSSVRCSPRSTPPISARSSAQPPLLA